MHFLYAGGKVDATKVLSVVEQELPMLNPPSATPKLLEQLWSQLCPHDQDWHVGTCHTIDSQHGATPPFQISFKGERM